MHLNAKSARCAKVMQDLHEDRFAHILDRSCRLQGLSEHK